LNEVQLKEKRLSGIHGIIQELKSILLHLPKGKEHNVCSMKRNS